VPHTLTFKVELDNAWTARSERGGEPLADDPENWTPEHLVLAGLCRCVLKSLAYHADRAALSVVSRASATGTITRRESDGRFAFVDIEVEAEAEISPRPSASDVRVLLEKAERDCFVGASLTAKPRYRWSVDDQAIA
jgi:organic hydroperoxide reductase OsmC/OhrA